MKHKGKWLGWYSNKLNRLFISEDYMRGFLSVVSDVEYIGEL